MQDDDAQPAPDEGAPMTAIGLVSTTALLVACGVHPADLGEAWAFARSFQYEAEHPSQMGRLVHAIQSFAGEKARERERAVLGRFGRHTAPIRVVRRDPPLP